MGFPEICWKFYSYKTSHMETGKWQFYYLKRLLTGFHYELDILEATKK